MAAEPEIVTKPELPGKYDIIPIHASDIAAFKRCRRYWDWSSPTRTNLRRKVHIYGINFPLWFGSGIHYALEMYYDPILQRDPVEAFITWFTYQWEGGVVTEDWLERTYDINPVKIADNGVSIDVATMTAIEYSQPLYRIQGLRDLHPDPDEEEFFTHKELGIGMMNFYKEYAPKHDSFRVIASESSFSVPLGFEEIDRREESPNYGKRIEVHARGKRDAVIQDLETEQFGIFDHKSKTKIDDAYFASLEKDEQVTNYMWASQVEAEVYGLPYTTISYVIHQALRKAYPKPPTPLSNSTPSLNRSEESTTAEMFEKYVRDNGLVPWFEGTPKAQAYYNYLVEKGDEQFIVRNRVYRNTAELHNQGEHIKAVAREMLDPNVAVYPHPTGDYLCINCGFRAPCIAKDDGSDYEYIIKDGYELNRDR